MHHPKVEVKGYILFYREKIRNSYTSIATLQQNVTLVGLKTHTEYSFRLLAYNSNGNGVASDEVNQFTSESGKIVD